MSTDKVYRTLGVFFFGLGTLGIGVPLLPTVVFWILAAFFFARSSPELRDRIYDHPRYGPPVRDFLEHGALSGRSKAFALGGMSFGVAGGHWAFGLPAGLTLLIAALLVPVAIYLLTRPHPVDNNLEDPLN